MTESNLAKLTRLLEAGTPGRWLIPPAARVKWAIGTDDEHIAMVIPQKETDAQLIAALHNAAPKLLEVVRAAKCEDLYRDYSMTNCGQPGSGLCDTCSAKAAVEEVEL